METTVSAKANKKTTGEQRFSLSLSYSPLAFYFFASFLNYFFHQQTVKKEMNT